MPTVRMPSHQGDELPSRIGTSTLVARVKSNLDAAEMTAVGRSSGSTSETLGCGGELNSLVSRVMPPPALAVPSLPAAASVVSAV